MTTPQRLTAEKEEKLRENSVLPFLFSSTDVSMLFAEIDALRQELAAIKAQPKQPSVDCLAQGCREEKWKALCDKQEKELAEAKALDEDARRALNVVREQMIDEAPSVDGDMRTALAACVPLLQGAKLIISLLPKDQQGLFGNWSEGARYALAQAQQCGVMG